MLDFYLSGGSGNTNPSLSLGGVKSSQVVIGDSYQFFPGDAIPGVTIVSGSGEAPNVAGTNNANLRFVTDSGNKVLIFTPARIEAGTPTIDFNNVQTVNVNGRYNFVHEEFGFIRSLTVDVIAASLPAIDTTGRLIVARSNGKLFDQLVAGDAADYRCLYLKNAGAVSENALVWVQQSPRSAVIMLGIDSAGAGGTASTVGTETTEPAGVTFGQYLSSESSISVSLSASQSIPLWIKRTPLPVVLNEAIGDVFELVAREI